MNDYFEMADALPERPTEPVREIVLRHIRPRPNGVQIDHSVVEHCSDSNIELLVDSIEQFREELDAMPEGVFLRVSARGERGNYLESGYCSVVTEMCVADKTGESKALDRDSADAGQIEAHIKKRIRTFLKMAPYL